MVRIYIQPGNVITLNAPTDVKSGDVVHVGSLIGVATYNARAGDEVETQLVGVWELPKKTGALTAGQVVFWDAAAKAVTGSDDNDAPLLGAVIQAAGADAPVVRVRLNGVSV